MSALPFICTPQIYAIRNNRLRVHITTKYTFLVRWPARKSTVAMAKSSRLIHLRNELSKNGADELVSRRILNSGRPSTVTTDPPLWFRGRTVYRVDSFRFGLTPLSFLLTSLISVFWISIPAITLSLYRPFTDFTRYHLGPRLVNERCSVTSAKGDISLFLRLVSL